MATVSTQFIKDILNTLPIGYYLGRRTNITFSETEPTSICNPMTGEIIVSANNVLSALADLPDTADTEEFVRDALYHELSHLILTPKNLHNTPQNNIFEDERIESLLSKYYVGVNFKRFVYVVNHWTSSTKPKDALQFFFMIVRYRKGPSQFVDRVKSIISEFSGLNSTTGDTFDYECAILDLWNDVKKYWEETESPESSPKSSPKSEGDESEKDGDKGESEDSSEEKGDTSESSSMGGEKKKKTDSDETTSTEESSSESTGSSCGDSGTSTGESSSEKSEMEKEIEKSEKESEKSSMDHFTPENIHAAVKKIFDSIIDNYADPYIESSLNKIITRACKRRANRVGVFNGYAGKIDPLSVGIRKDYRWFQKVGDSGSGKFDRIHLTLWVDRSGSFWRSMKKINCFVKSLMELERTMPKYFSFDVVTMQMDQEIHDKSKPIVAEGGNCFGPHADELYRKLHKAGWSNYDVVVWDGDLGSDKSYARCHNTSQYIDKFKKEFNNFNNQKTIIVSDCDNEKYLQKTCQNARMKMLRNNYAENFIQVVLEFLDNML